MRDLALAAIASRIGSGDRQRLLAPEANDEVDLLLGFLPVEGGVDAQVASALGSFFMLCGTGPGGDEQDLKRATILLTPTYLSEPDALPDPLRSWVEKVAPVARLRAASPAEALALTSAGVVTMLADRFLRRPEPGNRAALAGLALRAAAALPAGHPLREPVLCQLGDAILIAGPGGVPAAVSADPALLGETIEVLRSTLDRLPADDPGRARSTGALAATIRVAGQVTGDHGMLTEAADLMRVAAEADSDDERPVLRLAVEHLEAVRALPLPVAVTAEVMLSESAVLLAAPGFDAAQRAEIEEERATMVEALARRQRALDKTPEDFFDEAMARWGFSAQDDDRTVREIRALLARGLGADPGGELGDSRIADLLDTSGEQVDELAYLAHFADRVIRAVHSGDEPPAPAASPETDHSDLDEIVGVIERTLAEAPPGTDDYLQVEQVHLLLLIRRAPRGDDAESVAARADIERRIGRLMHTTITRFSERFSTREQVQTRAALEIGRLSPFGTMAAVDDAVARYRAELAAAPDRPDTLTYLAHALFGRYLFTSEQAVFDEAVGLARRALGVAAPPDPALALAWGRAAYARSAGATPGESAASTVPGSVMRILDGDAPAALVAFEREKAHLLSSAFTVGAEIDALRAARPDLADRLAQLRARSYEVGDLVAGPGAREREQALTDAWGAVLAEIRTLPGFDRFLLPEALGFDDLAAAADDGPVIAISVSELRCDALVLRERAVRVVPLPGLQAPQLVARAEAFGDATRALATSSAAAHRTITDTLAWLWDVVAEPVLSALGLDEHRDAEGGWPRVWWVPTGALTLLPLHAAGRHDVPGASVLDRVVSSYTPTLRALTASRSRRAAERVGALAVAMPHTPGHNALPATVREATAFAAEFGGPPPLVGPDATRAAVSAALPTATLVHFACHASSNPLAPWTSHLALHDGPLSAAEISDLRLDGAELAYLSACSTAGVSAVLADESIHISSAFQLAGYAQAVGTLWVVADEIAARVATEFHRELSTGAIRASGAAALHTVIRRLRADDVGPGHWAAYVHSGA